MSEEKKDEITNNEISEDDYEDTPEGPWAECHECDTLMGYSQKLERFRCHCCGKEIAEEDYEEYYDDNTPPYGCRACGGPWPNCQTSCKLFD